MPKPLLMCCPFCASKAAYKTHDGTLSVECRGCGATQPGVTFTRSRAPMGTYRLVADGWNTRTFAQPSAEKKRKVAASCRRRGPEQEAFDQASRLTEREILAALGPAPRPSRRTRTSYQREAPWRPSAREQEMLAQGPKLTLKELLAALGPEPRGSRRARSPRADRF